MKSLKGKEEAELTSKHASKAEPGKQAQSPAGEQDPQGSKWYTITVDHLRQGKNKVRTRLMLVIGSVAVAGGLVLAGNHYVTANTVPYYVVSVKGQAIGSILNKSELEQLFQQKRAAYQKKYPDASMVLNTNGITTTEEKAFKAQIDSQSTLKQLDKMLTAYAKGVEVTVGDTKIGVVKDQATIDSALKIVQKTYTQKAEAAAANMNKSSVKKLAQSYAYSKKVNKLESVKINQKVAANQIKANPQRLLSSKELAKVMLTGVEAPLKYNVREGDTISSIASSYDISQKEIFDHNPGIKETSLQIGDELTLTVPQPPITVTTVEDYSEQVVTEPDVEIRKSDNMRAGESKVISAGSQGLKRIDYRVVKENGQVLREEWVGQEVVKESSPKIIVKGTKVVVGEGSGNFIWPVSGATVTSPFGQRWGRMHKGIDMVGSSSVMAADDGVVTFAGTMTGYGNAIIIDHRNGYQTLYGHLSQIDVSNGTVVEKGQHIGVMGNTGHSFGTHLHFEVHSGGALQNPLSYLR